MRYAYLDKGGLLHVSVSKNTAAKYSKNNRVIATEIPAQNGYPVINGERAFVYGADEIYIGGNSNTGKKTAASDVPALAALYKSLM